MINIQDISVKDVMSVYSGKPERCCCGCAGNHRYASAHRNTASRHRGYKVRDNEVNDKQVKRVLNLVKANPDLIEHEATADRNNKFFSAEINGRLYVIYLYSPVP